MTLKTVIRTLLVGSVLTFSPLEALADEQTDNVYSFSKAEEFKRNAESNNSDAASEETSKYIRKRLYENDRSSLRNKTRHSVGFRVLYDELVNSMFDLKPKKSYSGRSP